MYIIDGVDGVDNVMIYPVPNTIGDIYQVYLLIDAAITDADAISGICKAAYFSLQKRRNIGETFSEVLALKPSPHTISGKITIDNEKDLNTILTLINDGICNGIFPKVFQTGYQQLMDEGSDINGIFNGPLLQNGWIQADNLGKKSELLSTIQVNQLIGAVPGVQSASILSFDEDWIIKDSVTSGDDEILVIDLVKSLSKKLEVYCNDKKLVVNSNFYIGRGQTQKADANIELGASVNTQTTVPSGKFRDINTYYSIQNTFPEIFAVGADAITSNASAFKMAQSRQLKGYLTLFDQVFGQSIFPTGKYWQFIFLQKLVEWQPIRQGRILCG